MMSGVVDGFPDEAKGAFPADHAAGPVTSAQMKPSSRRSEGGGGRCVVWGETRCKFPFAGCFTHASDLCKFAYYMWEGYRRHTGAGPELDTQEGGMRPAARSAGRVQKHG